MALLACIRNSISLEIYTDSNGKSHGELYLDDGETFNYAKDENQSTRIRFIYKDNILSSFFESGKGYDLPST